MTRRLLRLGLALAASCAILSATSASAQTSTTPTTPGAGGTVKPAPVAEGVYQVQAAPDATAGQSAAIVAVVLPPATKLPAMVRIPVPTGAVPTWAGEILGGDISSDIERPYRTVQGSGGQVLEMTLEETLTAQAEFVVSSQAGSGGTVAMNLNWVQASASAQTEFSVRLPSNVSQVAITPTPEGQPASNSLGETLYVLPTQVMKLGQTQVIAVSFLPQTGQTTSTSGTSSSGTTILLILAAVVLVLIAAILIAIRSSRAREE